jgi:hypothetical protein
MTITQDMIDKGYCPLCRKYFTGKLPHGTRERTLAVMGHIRGIIQHDISDTKQHKTMLDELLSKT